MNENKHVEGHEHGLWVGRGCSYIKMRSLLQRCCEAYDTATQASEKVRCLLLLLSLFNYGGGGSP